MLLLKRIVIGLVLVPLAGCAFLDHNLSGERRAGGSTSLVEYLYPEGEIPPDVATRVPHLELPLKVGLAFVPSRGLSYQGPSMADRTRLLEDVRQQFVGLDYVDEIRVIPETYLRGARGASGMQQVARAFDVDVMALISYDQITTTRANNQSLMYWTIVGAYIFEGTDHDTRTFVDLAVVDVKTQKLLLRAPGFDERRGDVTLVRADESIRRTSLGAMQMATDQMQQNLAVELVRFEERMKTKPDDIQVSYRGGGGALGVSALLFLIVLVGRTLRLRAR
ncbi:MAG: rhombotarget lipoprotein [Pseudomonadota bacterium]